MSTTIDKKPKPSPVECAARRLQKIEREIDELNEQANAADAECLRLNGMLGGCKSPAQADDLQMKSDEQKRLRNWLTERISHLEKDGERAEKNLQRAYINAAVHQFEMYESSRAELLAEFAQHLQNFHDLITRAARLQDQAHAAHHRAAHESQRLGERNPIPAAPHVLSEREVRMLADLLRSARSLIPSNFQSILQ